MFGVYEPIIETLIILTISTFVAYSVSKGMMQLGVLDIPEDRSSHAVPIPTSGGVAIIAGFFTFLCAYHTYTAPLLTEPLGWILAGACILGIVGYIDEIIEISFRKRLIIQLLVCGIVLWKSFPALPLGSPHYFVFLILLAGFINAYNFFDGLNGLATGSALVICLFAFTFFQSSAVFYLAFVPGFLGFLMLNLRGKIFQGDVGTFFTGLCLPSFLLLENKDLGDSVLFMGHLFFPMLFDVSVTIAHRLIRRKTVTKPHKGFFFHRLNSKGWPHLKVSVLYASCILLQGVTGFIFNFYDAVTVEIIYAFNTVFYSTMFWFLLRSRPTDGHQA